MAKDWKGNTNANATLAFTSNSDGERQREDFYATEPKAVELLLQLEPFADVWECACGLGHLSDVLKRHGIHAKSSDLIERGYGEISDFLAMDNLAWPGDIVTNPPYRYANEFILKALQIMEPGRKLALFLPIRYLEGKERKHIFIHHPPARVYISSSRLKCGINGVFDDKNSSAVCYAWFIWVKGHKGTTELKWFN